MRENNRKIEEMMISIVVLFLLVLTIAAFEKSLPKSFQQITGDVISTVNVTQPLSADCNFTFDQGYNLVSFFCIPNVISKEEVIGNLSSLSAIYEYQEGQLDSWKVYNPDLPSFVVQDLNFMSRLEGYWIIMNSEQSFYLNGSLRVPSYVTLHTGWNLAGYPTNRIQTPEDAFNSISGKFTEARAYDSSSGLFIGYVPGIGGALNQTEPYKGYWINATEEGVWTVV